MTMTAKRRRVHDKMADWPGVRAVRRPLVSGAGGDGAEFDLYYVRCGRKSAHPLVLIPGGPGAASVLLYRGLRRRAAAAGLDVIMVEHRGVGMSRHDDGGADLPPEALTIDQVVDDLAAVLDDAKVGSAIIYGTSYGSYIAAGVGVRHRSRVHAMVLDSPVLSAHDIDAMRAALRRVLWDGDDPRTAGLAEKVRRLTRDGSFTPSAAQLAAAVYGWAGPDLLDRQLDLLLAGRRGSWWLLGRLATSLLDREAPYCNEPDLVGRIGYRELDFAAQPDGGPLDPAVAYRERSSETAQFVGEPYDLVAQLPTFDWPTVVISGGRDLTTPVTVAERVAALTPGAVLLRLATAGHSLLDFREPAVLDIVKALTAGAIEGLPARTAALDHKAPRWPIRLLVGSATVAAKAESVLALRGSRIPQRVSIS